MQTRKMSEVNNHHPSRWFFVPPSPAQGSNGIDEDE